MSIYELAALGAAAAWAISSLISAVAIRELGSMGFNRIRLVLSVPMLAILVLFGAGWVGFDSGLLPEILLSGFIGIFLGDSALFASMRRLGPRRTSVLFAMNAPLTALFGLIWLGEMLNAMTVLGVILSFFGVALAIFFGQNSREDNSWEAMIPPLWLGVLLGILAASGQAIGSIIIRPILASGADPALIALLRVGIAALAMVLIGLASPDGMTRPSPSLRALIYTGISAFLGMVLGMTLIMYALIGAKAGIVATLSATSPVMLLPMLWWRMGRAPHAIAWAGALLVVLGSGFIFLG